MTGTQFKWREVPMAKAMEWMIGKTIMTTEFTVFGVGNGQGNGVILSDGTAILATSDWSGPYSKVTPDIDGDPPLFWIGEPK
jgi:hypothetical protein